MMMTRGRLVVLVTLSLYRFVPGLADGAPVKEVR